jgi:hypothetical protein
VITISEHLLYCVYVCIILNTDPYKWLYFILELSDKIHYDFFILNGLGPENIAGILKFKTLVKHSNNVSL